MLDAAGYDCGKIDDIAGVKTIGCHPGLPAGARTGCGWAGREENSGGVERSNHMTGFELFTTAMGIIGTVCAIVFGYIKSGVDDIKRKQEKEDERHVQVVSRLTAVEASAKQAHHRLDKLEEK